MNPRDRILATLDRKPTDRAPVDLWGTPEVLESLRQYTGTTDDLEAYQKLGLDKIVWVFPGYGSGRFDPNEGDGQAMWGVPTGMIRAGAATYQEFGTPLLGEFDDIAQLDDDPLWPDAANFNLAGARECNFATIGPWISRFEVYCQMRGLENALMDIAAEPDFLNATLDRIDAIQPICPGMDRDALPRDFGSQGIFHGGVDNQHVLPFGSVDDVRKETQTCQETLGRDGGFICSSCHNVQAGTPVENILAMIETVHQSKL